MRSNWKTIAFVAVAAVGGLLAGRALAEDQPMGPPEHQKSIETNGFVKLASGKWDVKSDMGDSGTTSFRLGLDKTAVLQDFELKSPMMGGVFAGYGVFKIADDGKNATLWWFSSHSAMPSEYKGTVSDAGYELSEGTGETATKITLAKKGEGLEWQMIMPGMTLTHTYTKAK